MPTLVVIEIPSREGYWEDESPVGELARGRGGGFSRTHGGEDAPLKSIKREISINYREFMKVMLVLGFRHLLFGKHLYFSCSR